MSEKKQVGSVTYAQAGQEYFAKRGFKRYARIWSLWALGVGAVISGHYSGWNFGIGPGGFGLQIREAPLGETSEFASRPMREA